MRRCVVVLLGVLTARLPDSARKKYWFATG